MASRRSNRRENLNSYHAFLESLHGKTVTIYRGGPESKTGKLLDVQTDYVTLYAQDNNNDSNDSDDNNNNNNNNQNNNQQSNDESNIIYYQAQHVKSISEDSKNNSTQSVDSVTDEEVEFLQAETFTGLMEQLANESIQINQGGPESKNGTLLGVAGDYLVLYTEDDGIVYFNVHHVKSIAKYQSNDDDNGNGNGNGNFNAQQQQSEVTFPEFVDANDFQDVFSHMAHKWVSINRGGPEAMEGVLVETAGGHYTLVSNEEVLRIHPFHIRSISAGPKGSMQNSSSDDSSDSDESSDSNNSESSSESKESSSSSSSSSSRSSSKSSSKSSRKREYSSGTTVKTIDYVWKGK
jgi:spore coat protein B